MNGLRDFSIALCMIFTFEVGKHTLCKNIVQEEREREIKTIYDLISLVFHLFIRPIYWVGRSCKDPR
jgi:hypothetical protein